MDITTGSRTTARQRAHHSKGVNLTLATLASVVCFWAWTSIAPLGIRYSDAMNLSSAQTSVLVAMPASYAATFVGLFVGRRFVGSKARP